MNAKRLLCITLAALASACAGTPTWDTSAFPQQMSYGIGTQAPDSVATAPAK